MNFKNNSNYLWETMLLAPIEIASKIFLASFLGKFRIASQFAFVFLVSGYIVFETAKAPGAAFINFKSQ